MIEIQCPECGAVLGEAELSDEELAQVWDASLRRGRHPTDEDYASSRAILTEQNRRREIVLTHLEAAHPERYWHTFPVVLPETPDLPARDA